MSLATLEGPRLVAPPGAGGGGARAVSSCSSSLLLLWRSASVSASVMLSMRSVVVEVGMLGWVVGSVFLSGM